MDNKMQTGKAQSERVLEIMRRLDEHYGTDPAAFLKSESPWQLLFATILSAQCTDERVNKVTEELYRICPRLQDIADMDIEELEEIIRSTGFYHSKAKNIKASAIVLIDKYEGRVPDTLKELTSLPGVGRKTANLILGNIYGIPSIVVDTHVNRISNRLGLSDSLDPVKTEFKLMEVLPKEFWMRWNPHIIAFGRSICRSQNPKCRECYLSDLCPSYGNLKRIEETRANKRQGSTH